MGSLLSPLWLPSLDGLAATGRPNDQSQTGPPVVEATGLVGPPQRPKRKRRRGLAAVPAGVVLRRTQPTPGPEAVKELDREEILAIPL